MDKNKTLSERFVNQQINSVLTMKMIMQAIGDKYRKRVGVTKSVRFRNAAEKRRFRKLNKQRRRLAQYNRGK